MTNLERQVREGGTAGILRGHLERVLSRDLRTPYRSAARRLLEALIDADRRRVVQAGAKLERELASWYIAAEDVRATKSPRHTIQRRMS